MMHTNKYISIFKNFFKNILSYALPVAILQFAVQPIIASKLGVEKNGLYLTLIAFVYFVTAVTSATLLQVRMLKNSEYVQNKINGDFNFLIIVFSVITIVATGIAYWLYAKIFSVTDYILVALVGLLYLVQNYLCVQYRLELKFSKILISNIVMCVGYLVGILLFVYVCDIWQIIFISAYSFCLIYDFCNTDIWKEKIKITPLFKSTFSKYLLLAFSCILSHLVTYGDRLLLYPLTDGESVSILVSAEIMGKMLMLLSSPLSSFLLCYLVKEEKINFSPKPKYILLAVLFLAFCYCACVLLSIPMLKLLYPEWAVLSIKYVPLVTLTSLVNLIAAVLNVIIIRFSKSKWQIVLSGEYLIVYLLFSFVLLKFFGLMGFCVGNLIAASIRILTIIMIGKFTINTK